MAVVCQDKTLSYNGFIKPTFGDVYEWRNMNAKDF